MYLLTLEEYSIRRIALVVPREKNEYRERLALEILSRMFPYSEISIVRNSIPDIEFESAIILSRPDTYFDLSQIGVMDRFFKIGRRCYEVFLVGQGQVETIVPQYLSKRIYKRISESIDTELRPEDFGIIGYTWNNGLLDVNKDVDLSFGGSKGLTKIPFSFGKVNGRFNCQNNKLTSLENFPKEINGALWISINKITSLEGLRIKIINGDFSCSYNNLTSLKGCPEKIIGDFNCTWNQLTSLEYSPRYVGGTFNCTDNAKITSIEDYPLCIIRKIIGVSGILLSDNFKEICNIVKENEEIFKHLLDNKIKFHQMVMRLNPDLIKYYKTIHPPTKDSKLLV